MRVNGIIVCDDIREEVGGKLTLVGVYSGGLRLDGSTAFPTLMKSLCVFIRVSLEEGDLLPDRLDVRGSFNGEQVLEHAGTLSVVNRAEPVTVRMAFVPFTLRGFGEMRFEFTFSSGANAICAFAEKVTIAANPA